MFIGMIRVLLQTQLVLCDSEYFSICEYFLSERIASTGGHRHDSFTAFFTLPAVSFTQIKMYPQTSVMFITVRLQRLYIQTHILNQIGHTVYT